MTGSVLDWVYEIRREGRISGANVVAKSPRASCMAIPGLFVQKSGS
jgi:hypothetical protein